MYHTHNRTMNPSTFARDAYNGWSEELRIKAPIKEHSEYRGQAQTVVQRAALLDAGRVVA